MAEEIPEIKPEPKIVKNIRQPTADELGFLIALAAVILGGWARLSLPAASGFPMNDGGLFYVMVQAVLENGFQLPAYIPYNGLEIPFVYPPLAFYLAAFLSQLFAVEIIAILLWFPAITLIFTIIAFYALAREMLASKYKAGIATLFFAFMPRTVTWLIMGGGLTRSLGQLFLILTITSVFLVFTKRSRKYLISAVFFSALVVLTHPEATVHTVGICLLLWVFKGRNKKGTLAAFLIAGGTILATAIWWLPLLIRFGPAPFLSAAQTSLHTPLVIFYPFLLTYTDEPLMTIVAVLALVGFVVQIAKGDYLLPGWLILPFMIEPRSAPTVVTLPLAMLAAVALSELIIPQIIRFENERHKSSKEGLFQSRPAMFLLIFIGFYMLGNLSLWGTKLIDATVSKANREAFEWVAESTPLGSSFLILTGNPDLFCDGVQDWFPALTGRVSETTLQGREWILGNGFSEFVEKLQAVQACLKIDPTAGCIEEAANDLGKQFDYLYISNDAPANSYCSAGAVKSDKLIFDLEQQDHYHRVYEAEDIAIYQYKKP